MIIDDLTLQEVAELDLRIAGKLIKESAFLLSRKVNQELLEPMSKWIDDPGWINRFEISEKETPDWAKYKRKKREWSKQQKELLRQRMKIYWQEFHKHKKMKRKVATLLTESRLSNSNKAGKVIQESTKIKAKYQHVAPILTLYSPAEEKKRNTSYEFIQILKTSVPNLLPWRTILTSEIQESNKDSMTLSEFKTYYDEDQKKDITAKLIHLLLLESEGYLELSQKEPFGEISVSKPFMQTQLSRDGKISTQMSPRSGSITYQQIDAEIQIKDRKGNIANIDWQQLSNAQRNKVVKDIKNNRIIYKAM